MASVILSTVATAIAPANPFAALAMTAGAKLLGGMIDNNLMGGGKSSHREGARLEELGVQTSTYGKAIPLIYGNARIAGNVIWSRPIKEVATTTTSSQGGKGGGGGAKSSSTDFSYFVTLAIAICEGPVDAVERAWADAKQLDLGLGTYRFYRGDEAQLPDALMESYEGIGHTPAYRGLCYVVIEDFPLADYGNRIPNFTFEVKKKILWPDFEGQSVEEMVTSVIMIPGSGEFVYDTVVQQKLVGEEVEGQWVQRGELTRINSHTPSGKANSLLALDQLEDTLPNVEWVGLVVNWFGTDMAAGECIIKPGVEYGANQATTEPEIWTVGGFTRGSAHPITYVGESPRYGGTPDDQSLLRYLDELRARGYQIFFYPMFLMDTDAKPWRGRVTGSASEVASFFTKTNGYNAFITHYAHLVAGKVDAFAIGSELIGLTKVSEEAGVYPAVDQLIALAETVKSIVGSEVKVTYAADWSEYHHTEGGWYNLDPLWACAAIDFVGIDAYFPLTNLPQNELGYDIETVMEGWSSGEGYEYYYTDESRTETAPLGAAYAWKNMAWWWENTHTNPDESTTAWEPQSKPIWLTEYGFPSVDGATNQPNVFYDPASSESYFPRLSRGRIDFRAQRLGIAATEAKWKDSPMIEQKFLWTWDARPFPYWPDLLSVWADGGVWKTGHWVQGKLGASSLAAIVADLCQRAGLSLSLIDVSRLQDQVEGYIINAQSSARQLIEQLMAGYFFDAVESDGVLKFIPRGNAHAISIHADDIIPLQQDDATERLTITRQQEFELPQRVEVSYINRLSNYQTGMQHSQRMVSDSRNIASIGLPIVMADQRAKVIADISLYQSWMARTRYQFDVPMRYGELEPADVIELMQNDATHVIRITEVTLGRPGMLRIAGEADDVASYDFYAPPAVTEPVIVDTNVLAPTRMALLDIPALATDAAEHATLRFAAAGLSAGWAGAVIYRSDDEGGSYQRLVEHSQACVMGAAVSTLGDGPSVVFDEVGSVDVVLIGTGSLHNAGELAVLNGANLALIGQELIQFKQAVELASGKYRLSGLLRGRLGTEYAISAHGAGERFILLDARLQKDAVPDGLFGLSRMYKGASFGQTLGQVQAESFTYQARALKPYAPVHIGGMRDDAGNLTLHWVRRARLGGAWRDGVDIPINEASEAYDIEIMSGDSVVRLLHAATPEILYSAAEQTDDFGAPLGAVSVRIYQLSQRVGRGYPAAAIV